MYIIFQIRYRIKDSKKKIAVYLNRSLTNSNVNRKCFFNLITLGIYIYIYGYSSCLYFEFRAYASNICSVCVLYGDQHWSFEFRSRKKENFN